MEEKEVNSIASAVSKELAKLNATAEPKTDNKDESNESKAEVFNCPECGSPVKAMVPFCPQCGCGLEWEA